MQPKIIHADCKEAIRELIEQGVQVDSIVTDPPYELGFMGKAWDSTGIAYDKELWQLCLQILKPGGHLLAFGGSRTYHRMACAIEDAGFEIRDQIMWLYGSGFPKSLDISKAIDKMAGAEREIVGYKPIAYEDSDCWGTPNKNSAGGKDNSIIYGERKGIAENGTMPITAPATESAKQWQGWGSALKPAHEPIVMARKPLNEKTIAENVLKHGTGAINIDGCRVETQENLFGSRNPSANTGNIYGEDKGGQYQQNSIGRFPANLIHDGSDEVEQEFAKYGDKGSDNPRRQLENKNDPNVYGKYNLSLAREVYDPKGTASRFFYCAKASKKERNGSKHPTVKPLALMRYLCRLITPPGGTILDPFAGTGTTGQAAIEEGFNVILIEKESQYVEDIKARFNSQPQFKQEGLNYDTMCAN